MILVDRGIKRAMERGQIVIEPFRAECVGTNSYDVHLGKTLGWYSEFDGFGQPVSAVGQSIERAVHGQHDGVLDCKIEPPFSTWDIGPEGFLLLPGRLYLGVTEEYTETLGHVPMLEGKSSLGRLGMFVHCTAGRGDVGFKGHWTMEITVVQPLRVYAGMPVAQLIYYVADQAPEVPYNAKGTSKYNNRDPQPQPSKMARNFR